MNNGNVLNIEKRININDIHPSNFDEGYYILYRIISIIRVCNIFICIVGILNFCIGLLTMKKIKNNRKLFYISILCDLILCLAESYIATRDSVVNLEENIVKEPKYIIVVLAIVIILLVSIIQVIIFIKLIKHIRESKEEKEEKNV